MSVTKFTKYLFRISLAVTLASKTPMTFASEPQGARSKENVSAQAPSQTPTDLQPSGESAVKEKKQAENAQAPMPSPYFVVGFLCEGIAIKANGVFPGNEDFSKRLERENNRIACENNFTALGVEKYQWISLQDLEQLEFRLKREDPDAEHKIEIVSAEGPGHIYLKLTIDKKTSLRSSASLFATLNRFSGVSGESQFGQTLNGSISTQNFRYGPFQNVSYGLDFKVLKGTQAHSERVVQFYRPWIAFEDRIFYRLISDGNFSLNYTNSSQDDKKNSFNANINFLYVLTNPNAPYQWSMGPTFAYLGKQALVGGKFYFTTKAEALSYYTLSTRYLTDTQVGESNLFDYAADYQSRISDGNYFWGLQINHWSSCNISMPAYLDFATNGTKSSNAEEKCHDKSYLDSELGVKFGYALSSGKDTRTITLSAKSLVTPSNAGFRVGLEYNGKMQNTNIKLGVAFQSRGKTGWEPLR